VVPGAFEAMIVHCNLEVRPIREGPLVSEGGPNTGERTSKRKTNKENKERGKWN